MSPRARGRLRLLGLAAGLALLGAAAWLIHLAQRGLPQLDGRLRVEGLTGPVEILRDRYGVPHIFAAHEPDAAFGLGFVHAQDRLFQLELTRHLAQGRLAELFGARALRMDRLFRTFDLHGAGRRAFERARPEAQALLRAYAAGVNSGAAQRRGRLPPEFALLRRTWQPAREDDFLGAIGYMTWGLNLSWTCDPLYERLQARLGAERAGLLFPWNFGGQPAVHAAQPQALPPAGPPAAGAAVFDAQAWARRLAALDLNDDERELLAAVPRLEASNNWVVAPQRSRSGQALLANDPHLAHGLPGIWYEAHLRTPTLDVLGVTLPGLPLVVIGHNRDIAWGFTNVMLDAADFFVEELDPADPTRVRSGGRWVPLETRREVLRVRGGAPRELLVRHTPHGPLVSDLLAEDFPEDEPPPARRETRALAYRWTYLVDSDANEIDGFYLLNRAKGWDEFRAALRRFGGLAQNVAYADRAGHIGLQTTGSIPRLRGQPDGSGFRAGDGTQEWDGFVPFDELPASFDPPEGLLSSANNPTLPPGAPYYISSQWEPRDRIERIREQLAARPLLSPADLAALHSDSVLPSARRLAPLVLAACAGEQDATARAAAELWRGWDGDMRAESGAPLLFAAFYRRLFYELFEDELGPELARDYRRKANLSAIMIDAALFGGAGAFVDRTDTPQAEERGAVLCTALRAASAELAAAWGPEPRTWRWGRAHTLELKHPFGRLGRPFAWYFNRGPFAVPGHTSTVNKMEFRERDFRVVHGPSMRQVTDLADWNTMQAVLPGGQSGLPASPHYDDMLPLWLAGRYHPFPMDRAALEPLVKARLTLEP